MNAQRHWHLQVATCALMGLVVMTTPLSGQDDELQSQVQLWLETTCGLVDAVSAPLSPAALGTASVPLFIDAFQAGPANTAVELVRTAAARRFDKIDELLRRGNSFGLSPADLATLRETERETFIGQSVSDFALNYGDNALRALGTIGGTASRDFLLSVAQDSDSPHAATARTLLLEAR